MIFAYLDPGAGSLIFQALLAAALAVPLFFRSTVRNIVDRVRGRAEGRPASGMNQEPPGS
jgi:hypothetical protein